MQECTSADRGTDPPHVDQCSAAVPDTSGESETSPQQLPKSQREHLQPLGCVPDTTQSVAKATWSTAAGPWIRRHNGNHSSWDCFVIGKSLLSCALEDFPVSSIRCLMRRYVVNLWINRTERKKQDSNSDRGSEAHVCNSALSPDGVLFTVSSTSERALAALA